MAIARSRDFLWTRKVLFRDNVEHSSGQNVETTSLSARQKGRVEKTWVKECSKPYRDRPLLACFRSPCTVPRLWLLNPTSRFSGPGLFIRMATARSRRSFTTSTFSDSRFLKHMALFNHDILLHVTGHKVMVHSTKIIVTICHVNMLRSELFQTNGQYTFMTLLPPAGHQGHKE